MALGELAGSSKALLASILREQGTDTLIVCCLDEVEVEEWADDLKLFSPSGRHRNEARVLPELERNEELEALPASLRARSRILEGLGGGDVLLLTMSSLMAPVAPAASTHGERIELRVGGTLDPHALFDRAKKAGMRRVPQVVRAGEISLRGDVLDVFAEGLIEPLRVEFFDDEIESIRSFDPSAQASTAELEAASFELVHGRSSGSLDPNELPHPLDLVDRPKAVVLVVEPVRFEEQLSRFTLREGTLSRQVAAFQEALKTTRSLSLSTLPVTGGQNFGVQAPRLAAVESWDLKGRILAASKLTERPFVVLRSEPEVERLRKLARETLGGASGFDAVSGHLAHGFRIPDLDRCVLNHGEFFGTGVARRRVRGKKARASIESTALGSFFELQTGDLVVHAVHGIAKFVGIERAPRGMQGGEEDHLRLAFADDVEVLVPASKIDLVQKYVGAGGGTPKLDKLGGKSFSRRKAQVAKALRDMASELLDVQIERQRSPGFACPKDDDLYDEFEAAFPWDDTPDQSKSTREINGDLVSTRPMDRLLCGDVGFGKTELAMRAAFRVVSAGRQVAILAPTTLLADQHGRTFRERFASFPVRIEVLSRLQTPKQKREILEALAKSEVDILIGTHRLLGKQVKFAELGLLVIDEEQRFGVAHKEKIRSLRANIDVLTMTATPIPRTLHMSLLGIKDISSLSTPPTGRLEIETKIAHRQAGVIRRAILHELARGGQVFFLHNRVYDIEQVRRELEDIVPEARYVIGHGQMSEKELLGAMQSFLRAESDVLISTTIIESGIDIPRANTILVDNAHDFGLADLHQLRGRVGRDVHKAHCWLLVDPTRPMSNEAQRRLQAMEKFSELGAGFQIAMRDLEIRGAGNLLGPEQSGHIAAIGYDMYCKLLQAAVDRTQSGSKRLDDLPEFVVSEQVDIDLGVEAFVPEDFAGDQRLRLALLRELDGAVDAASLERIEASLQDRHGRLPAPIANLLSLFFVKHQLGARGIRSARWLPPDQIVLQHAPGRVPHGAWLDAFADVRPVAADRTTLVMAAKSGDKPEDVLALIEGSLRGRPPRSKLGGGRKRQRRRRRHE